jgi:hypothetical protein
MTFWVIKHPKSQTVKLYFTAKTEDKLSNSGNMGSALISEIKKFMEEVEDKIKRRDNSFSIANLEPVEDSNDPYIKKAGLKKDRDKNKILLKVNPEYYQTLDNDNKRRALIYHEVIHFWIGEDIPPDDVRGGSDRDKLYEFIKKLDTKNREYILNVEWDPPKPVEQAFEELIVHKTTEVILGLDDDEYYQLTNFPLQIFFMGVNIKIDQVLIKAKDDFPDIKKVMKIFYST